MQNRKGGFGNSWNAMPVTYASHVWLFYRVVSTLRFSQKQNFLFITWRVSKAMSSWPSFMANSTGFMNAKRNHIKAQFQKCINNLHMVQPIGMSDEAFNAICNSPSDPKKEARSQICSEKATTRFEAGGIAQKWKMRDKTRMGNGFVNIFDFVLKILLFTFLHSYRC